MGDSPRPIRLSPGVTFTPAKPRSVRRRPRRPSFPVRTADAPDALDRSEIRDRLLAETADARALATLLDHPCPVLAAMGSSATRRTEVVAALLACGITPAAVVARARDLGLTMADAAACLREAGVANCVIAQSLRTELAFPASAIAGILWPA